MGTGKKLDQILRERNINVNVFANQLGVRPQRIYNIILRDTKNVKRDLVKKMAENLSIPVEYFYTDKTIAEYVQDNKYISDALKNIDMENHQRNESRSLTHLSSYLLIFYFGQLNENGKKELLKRASEMTRLSEYTIKDNDDIKNH